MLDDDILGFFRAIGVNDELVVKSLPSGDRQQNASVLALGIDWVFQQEHGYQDVEMRNPAYPDHGISVQQIDFCLNPPSEQQISLLAKSEPFLWSFDTLAQAAGYIRPHLPEIVELVTSDRIVVAKSKLRTVIKRIFDAV